MGDRDRFGCLEPSRRCSNPKKNVTASLHSTNKTPSIGSNNAKCNETLRQNEISTFLSQKGYLVMPTNFSWYRKISFDPRQLNLNASVIRELNYSTIKSADVVFDESQTTLEVDFYAIIQPNKDAPLRFEETEEFPVDVTKWLRGVHPDAYEGSETEFEALSTRSGRHPVNPDSRSLYSIWEIGGFTEGSPTEVKFSFAYKKFAQLELRLRAQMQRKHADLSLFGICGVAYVDCQELDKAVDLVIGKTCSTSDTAEAFKYVRELHSSQRLEVMRVNDVNVDIAATLVKLNLKVDKLITSTHTSMSTANDSRKIVTVTFGGTKRRATVDPMFGDFVHKLREVRNRSKY